MPACPLCGAHETRVWAHALGAVYYRCAICRLTFLDPACWPSPDDERARYREHDNHPGHRGYRRFLTKLAAPVDARLPRGADGLDFGCGPGPTLSVLLRERGHRVADYDPFFVPDDGLLTRQYTVVTCSEVFEHLHHPARTLDRLHGLVAPGGILALMTEPVDDTRDFAAWPYLRDRTHVCFAHPDTFAWIARRWGWWLERPRWTVALFRKPASV